MNTKIQGLTIKAVSVAVPKETLPIATFYEIFGEQEVKRIALSTGVESVHVANKKIKTSELCQAASLNLFQELDIAPSSIDGIVFISQTPDFKMPATSCILQDKLKLRKDIVAFDINYGCSGYIYGLYQAALLVKSGGCKRVLICVGDTITDCLDPNDHKSRLVFGDGASASLVEEGLDEWAFDIRTDGSGFQDLIIPKGDDGNDKYLLMNGGAIMEFVLREIEPVFYSVLTQQNWNKESLSHVILHQANEFIVHYIRKQLNMEQAKVPIAVRNYGNTGSASIPLTLCNGPLKEHDLGKTILIGFGVGLSWGACALNLSGCKLLKILNC